MVKEKKSLTKRKEAEQKPNTIKQYFPTALSTIEFANLEGRLAISGQDTKEIIELMQFVSTIPSVAVFMEVEKAEEKRQ